MKNLETPLTLRSAAISPAANDSDKRVTKCPESPTTDATTA